MIAIEQPTDPSRAVRIAQAREVMPTSMGSAEIRNLDPELRKRSVFSARTTNAAYLQKIRDVTVGILRGDFGLGQARATLRQTLRAMGYTPEGGFADDDARNVPPAIEGTIQDLSSFARLDLIVRTQEALMRGAALQLRGMEPDRLNAFPVWEFVRQELREETRNWPERWERAGGPELIADASSEYGGRFFARKDDLAFWKRLGSSDLFEDALDTAHPPFAFRSGMGWVEIDREEAHTLGLLEEGETIERPDDPALVDEHDPFPTPSFGLSGLDDDFIDSLGAELDDFEDQNGQLVPKV